MRSEMEYSDHGFLEELLAVRTDPWETTIPTEMNDFYNNGVSFHTSNETQFTIPSNSSLQHLSLPFYQTHSSYAEFYQTFGDEFSAADITESSSSKLDTPFPTQEDYSLSNIVSEEQCIVSNGLDQMALQVPCELESIQGSEVPSFNMGILQEKKNKAKKVDGQPSKNLMAERRRRKRLNDRLTMLRSVVPKISKMDRTSILGDTIDYMKELLERINNLQEETDQVSSNELNLLSIFRDVNPNEILVKNSPKFDVERRNMDTRVQICCAGKPGLLLSTVTTLEALGLEIQQCVISCFNDFAMQASCSEVLEHREIVSSEDIKQSLFKNAGYGGRCL